MEWWPLFEEHPFPQITMRTQGGSKTKEKHYRSKPFMFVLGDLTCSCDPSGDALIFCNIGPTFCFKPGSLCEGGI